jgi:hypothetical protein
LLSTLTVVLDGDVPRVGDWIGATAITHVVKNQRPAGSQACERGIEEKVSRDRHDLSPRAHFVEIKPHSVRRNHESFGGIRVRNCCWGLCDRELAHQKEGKKQFADREHTAHETTTAYWLRRFGETSVSDPARGLAIVPGVLRRFHLSG